MIITKGQKHVNFEKPL